MHLLDEQDNLFRACGMEAMDSVIGEMVSGIVRDTLQVPRAGMPDQHACRRYRIGLVIDE